jgi:cell wall-associated NlpC family hydrolase
MSVATVTREAVVAEARTWLGTPYHLNQCVRGAGVDCARFIHAVLHACGLMPAEFIERFGTDWASHTSEEVYKFRMLRHAPEILEGISFPSLKAKPGCVALVKTEGARVYNHGAIVLAWPRCIHAVRIGVSEFDASQHELWAQSIVKIFDPFGGHA